jgi:hypothetical protein
MALLYGAFPVAGGEAVGNLAYCAVATLLRVSWRVVSSAAAAK